MQRRLTSDYILAGSCCWLLRPAVIKMLSKLFFHSGCRYVVHPHAFVVHRPHAASAAKTQVSLSCCMLTSMCLRVLAFCTLEQPDMQALLAPLHCTLNQTTS